VHTSNLLTMAAAATATGFERDVNHNPDAVWESTSKPTFNRVMHDFAKFDDIVLDDLLGDHSIVLMSTFANRMAESPPISPMKNTPYKARTLNEIFTQVIKKFKDKFANQSANLPDLFPDDLVAKWKKKIKDGRSRTMMEGEEEGDLFKNTFPIPREHSARTILIPFHDFQDPERRDHARRIDLKKISKYLFDRERFSDLAKIVITFKAIGRGGEVKFLSYQRMMIDETYNLMFTQWFQRKTLKSSPSAFAVDFEYPWMCPFFSLGCFWACDSGLSRPNGAGAPGTALARRDSYVFQDLHTIQDNKVATELGKIIKSTLVGQMKPFYSVKSLRVGAMSLLAWDPCVTYEEAVALGGWSTQSNSDWYVWIYLVAIIPAALALGGYPDPRVIPYLPSNGKLFFAGDPQNHITADQFSSFLSELFPNSLPEFAPPHGRLRSLLVRVCACMIMHFDAMYREHGNRHRYICVMVNAVRRSQIAPNSTVAINKLQAWSKLIRDDFRSGNLEPNQLGNVLRRNTIQDQIARMNSEVGRMLTRMNDVQATLAQQSLQAG